MKNTLYAVSLLLSLFLVGQLDASAAERPIRVAVASNFAHTADELRRAFNRSGASNITISAASSGKHYAQIVNGAPFDLFLSADAERPMRLEQSGAAAPGSRFTYAEGRLVVWSRDESLQGRDCLAALSEANPRRIAIANPRSAPYGVAAREALRTLGLWQAVEARLVYGENIGQTLQFVASGSARIGFVAAAQLQNDALPPAACRWEVPASAHEPIRQQAVLLTRAADRPDAKAFLNFIRSETGRAIIARDGYRLAGTD